MKAKPLQQIASNAIAADALGLALAVAVPPIASRRWGVDGFAEYSIVYRALAFLQPSLLLGLAVALPRFLGMDFVGRRSKVNKSANPETYLVACLAVVGAVLLAVLISIVLAGQLWSSLLFGDSEHVEMLFALEAMLCASCGWALASAYLRSSAVSPANARSSAAPVWRMRSSETSRAPQTR